MARNFNGSSDRITVNSAHIVAQSTAFSISLWARSSSGAPTTGLWLYGETMSTSVNAIFSLQTASPAPSTRVQAFLRNSAGSARLNLISTATPFADTNFHSIIYAQSAANIVALYCDGVKATGSYTASGVLAPDGAAIGFRGGTSNSSFWPGDIAEVALFSRQLTDAEAAAIAAGLPASHLGPAHYWPLWGVDSPEPDLGNI